MKPLTRRREGFDSVESHAAVGLSAALLAVGLGIAGCEDPEAPPVEDGPLVLHDIHVRPAVTRADEPFNLSLDVDNVAGSVLTVWPGDVVGLRRDGDEQTLLTASEHEMNRLDKS